MKKLYCVADVHSFYDELMLVLNQLGFDADDTNHIFVHCGDLLDRGPKPAECLEFVNSLAQNRKILIRGNHEDLLEDAFKRGEFFWHDLHNGTIETVYKLSHIDKRNGYYSDFVALQQCFENPDLKAYMCSLQDYVEVGDYIFVHGWIPNDIYNWRNGNWSKARWENGMKKWHEGIRLDNKTIVCGHYHTSWGHCHLHHKGIEFKEYYSEFEEETDENRLEHFEPFIDKGIIALDGCTAYSGKVNCKIIEIEDELCRLSM